MASKSVSVRINATDTPWCHDDIIELVSRAGAQISTVVLAKTNQAADVHFVHLLLDQLEQKLGLENRIGIEGLIEDVSGLLCIEDIAGASDRLESLIFGMGDYSASQHMRLTLLAALATTHQTFGITHATSSLPPAMPMDWIPSTVPTQILKT